MAGALGWCMADYNTHKEFGSGDRICYHGVLDMFRNPKLSAAVYASQKTPRSPSDIVLEVSSSESIGSGLEEQIENFKKEHSDLKVVFIDTLQMIRESTDNGYGSDYKELFVLKNLADKLEIAIVVVHHTRKCSDSDPFNMISGSTGSEACILPVVLS